MFIKILPAGIKKSLKLNKEELRSLDRRISKYPKGTASAVLRYLDDIRKKTRYNIKQTSFLLKQNGYYSKQEDISNSQEITNDSKTS